MDLEFYSSCHDLTQVSSQGQTILPDWPRLRVVQKVMFLCLFPLFCLTSTEAGKQLANLSRNSSLPPGCGTSRVTKKCNYMECCIIFSHTVASFYTPGALHFTTSSKPFPYPLPLHLQSCTVEKIHHMKYHLKILQQQLCMDAGFTCMCNCLFLSMYLSFTGQLFFWLYFQRRFYSLK